MTPTYEIAEWAEELGIKGAKDCAWDWLGDLMVFDNCPLPFACGCRIRNQTSWWKPHPEICPNSPSYEKIKMKRLGESEYMVGQCERCSRIVWLRAQVV